MFSVFQAWIYSCYLHKCILLNRGFKCISTVFQIYMGFKFLLVFTFLYFYPLHFKMLLKWIMIYVWELWDSWVLVLVLRWGFYYFCVCACVCMYARYLLGNLLSEICHNGRNYWKDMTSVSNCCSPLVSEKLLK